MKQLKVVFSIMAILLLSTYAVYSAQKDHDISLNEPTPFPEDM